MPSLTLTEALAEIKTIQKRLVKKQEYIKTLLARDERIKDPLEKQGGSQAAMDAEWQSVKDLESRIVLLRTSIQAANHRIRVMVQTEERTLMEWLTWRKEVAPLRKQFLSSLSMQLLQLRKEAQSKGCQVVPNAAVASGDDSMPNVLVMIDEAALHKELEQIELVLGELDGQLSLKNAIETITV